MTTSTPLSLRCSFCGRAETEIARLIAGPGVYVCNECVQTCTEILAAAPNESTGAIPPWADMDLDEILRHLPQIAAVGAQVEESLRRWVELAREHGATWARVGEALGMTKQSAWERFSGEE